MTDLDALGIEPSVWLYGRPLYSKTDLAPLIAKARRVDALEAALREIADLEGEINPSNYDHDDACELNRQFCYGLAVAHAALKENTDD